MSGTLREWVRRRANDLSLRDHLTIVSALAVGAALLIASVAVFVATRHQLRAQLDETLARLADQPMLEQAPVAGRFSVVLNAEGFEGDRGIAQFVPSHGSLPAPAVPAMPGGSEGTVEFIGPEVVLPISDRARAVAAGSEGPYYQDVQVGGQEMRVYTRQVLPDVAVQVAHPLDEVNGVLSRLAVLLIVIAVGGALFAARFGRAIAASALARVGRLTEVAETVTQTRDFRARMEVEGSDELSRLAASFNSMLDSLEASIRSQRQLVGDASHELRTPLTSIRTNIEVLSRASDLREDERRRILNDVTTQLEELATLVANLVELARDGEAVTSHERVFLDDLVEEVVGRMRRLNPSITFECQIEPCVTMGDPARIDRAVANLLDNAVKYNSEGQAVEIVVANDAVTVRDRGAGIAEEDLPYIFERFYRAPSARGRPGSGLGLAIVKDVAESSGGSITAVNAPGGGASFTLHLPLPEQQARDR